MLLQTLMCGALTGYVMGSNPPRRCIFECAFHHQFTLITLQSTAQPSHSFIIGLFNCSFWKADNRVFRVRWKVMINGRQIWTAQLCEVRQHWKVKMRSEIFGRRRKSKRRWRWVGKMNGGGRREEMIKKRLSYPCNRPWRHIGLWNVEAPTFSRKPAHRWRWGC
jgi:hypothetical protein